MQQGQLAERQATRRQQASQFQQEQTLARRKLDQDLESIRADTAYKQALAEYYKTGGNAGQVNERWDRLTGLIGRQNPGISADDARALAWLLMNPSDQSRQELKADLMQKQMLFQVTADPTTDPNGYQQQVQQLSNNIDDLLDAAGVASGPGPGVLLPGQPGSLGGQRTTLSVGSTVDVQGNQGTVIAVTPYTVTIDYGDPIGQKTHNRVLVEQSAHVVSAPGPTPTVPGENVPGEYNQGDVRNRGR